MSTSLTQSITEALVTHNVRCEELTAAQLAETVRQAIACGDIQRLVQVSSGGQVITYIPGRENQRLRDQIAALEEMRPHWAQGYTSDGVAAQTTSAALSQLWKLIGAKDQTEAVQILERNIAGKVQG